MRSKVSQATSRLLSTLKAKSSLLALFLGVLTLVVTATALIVALYQFRDAKRALELNAVATTVSLYSGPKTRFYDVVLKNANILSKEHDTEASAASPDLIWIKALARLHLRDYLHGIEVACDIYLGPFLNEAQKRFIADYVAADIDLLRYSYHKSGTVGFLDADLDVPWITPALKSTDDTQTYTATPKCLEEWNIKLEPKSLL